MERKTKKQKKQTYDKNIKNGHHQNGKQDNTDEKT